jgi:hypothetical protein
MIKMEVLDREQQRHNERKSYTDMSVYQYCHAIKATRAATCSTKVGHTDGVNQIFEDTNKEQSTEVSKSIDSEQEQPMAPSWNLQPPQPLSPHCQQQKQTTADQTAACSS